MVVAACGSTARPATFDAPPDAAVADVAVPPPPGDATPPLFGDSAPVSEGGTSDPKTEVDVVITADNAYAFAWGTATSVSTLKTVAPSVLACEIFCCPIGRGPEAYVIPAEDSPPGAYIYVIAWADRATTQGVIGQFKRRGGQAIYTGDGAWEVCATGVEYTPSSGLSPTQQIIDDQLAICNGGTGSPTTTSAGWVGPGGATGGSRAVGRLVFGEDNSDPGGDFPVVCQRDADGKEGVNAAAKWMWYSPEGANPFRYVGPGNSTRAFLIFRLPTRALPDPPK